MNAAARAELELARSRWSSGLKDKRELLAQANAVLEQVYVLDALDADYLSSHVDLIQALGGGYLRVQKRSRRGRSRKRTG